MISDEKELILNFHGTGEIPRSLDPGEHQCWLSSEEFGQALDFAAARPSTIITFDDGNSSDIKVALPALLARGLRAKFFVLSGRLSEKHFLFPSDLRELVASGMSIGTHGRTHRPWKGLNSKECEDEFVIARREIEDIIGAAVEEAACPFGVYCRASLLSLRRAGMKRVYTSDRGWSSSGQWLVPRNTLHRGRAIAEASAAYANQSRLRTLLRNLKIFIKSKK